jgi:metal-responsive CopG/Arc/MetJ family transcriptional regulator
MPKTKIAISMDAKVLARVDDLVQNKVFRNRSQAIESSVAEKLLRMGKVRLAAECAKLDRAAERELADEGLSDEVGEWPEY